MSNCSVQKKLEMTTLASFVYITLHSDTTFSQPELSRLVYDVQRDRNSRCWLKSVGGLLQP